MARKTDMNEVMFVALAQLMQLLYTAAPNLFIEEATQENAAAREYAGVTPSETEFVESTSETDTSQTGQSLLKAVTDFLSIAFLVAQLFQALIRTYPALEVEMAELLSRLWDEIDRISTEWTGVSIYEEAEV